MGRQDLAIEHFKEGYDCSKSILSTYINEMNINQQQAKKMTEPFGTFLGKPREICGIIEASFCIINYHHNQNNIEEEKAKQIMNSFRQSFLKNHNSLLCKELLGTDLATLEGKINAIELGICDSKCIQILKDAITILEEVDTFTIQS